jgi:hypothetical protein
MSQFINLSRIVINKLHIVDVIKSQSKYTIRMSINNIDGCLMFSCGGVGSTPHTIEICEKTDKLDYDNITKFINDIK